MKIQDVSMTGQIWEFVKEKYAEAGFSDELIHGLRHMRHVREVCAQICDAQLLSPQIVKCLRAAVDVHDVGHAIDKSRDHAMVSAEVFLQMSIGDLDVEEFQAVHFAVANHSRGLLAIGVREAKSLREKVLGLLCVCDHADTASPDGVARAIRVIKGKPILSTRFTAEHLRELMVKGCAPEMMNVYKNDSLVAHLAYNYAADALILASVRYLLDDRYLDEWHKPRVAMYRTIVATYLTLQEKQNILNV